jgi:hypothetical protein
VESVEVLLAGWREAEAAVEAAERATPEWRRARVRADVAKTAYLTAVGDVFDVEGHSVNDAAPTYDVADVDEDPGSD